MTVLLDLQPLLLGMDWMDPTWLLDQFGQTLFWLSLAFIFVECGMFFPFLPGDTLLFAMGLFISGDKISILPGHHSLDLLLALVLFTIAAIGGNVSGYEIGRKIGPPLYQRDGRILKRKYFDQTTTFFDKHGNKALVIGRFVPFVRTYITVVAGVTRMDRRRFFLWSLVGAVAWVVSITLLGYFLGAAFPWLGENIDYAIIAILLFSVVPIAWEWWRHRRSPAATSGDTGQHPDALDVLSQKSDPPVN
ncbi:VTT domain-containing protein [Nocardioides sp.]|uniref:DedA family protein n=1 Tax=Nocardioides sp. TaxID=35761 RepID=UPI00286EAE2E|nr:VTT domain-containing protein [Nocardioides sp.]